MSERVLDERVLAVEIKLELIERRWNDLELALEGTGLILDALINKVFPDGFPSPEKGKGDRSPEEVEKLLKWGIRMGKLKPKELLYCMSFVAGYLNDGGLLSTEQSLKIQSIVADALK